LPAAAARLIVWPHRTPAKEQVVALAQRPPIQPIRSAVRLRTPDDGSIERLKQASLQILERVGVRFDSPRALSLLREHGANVDADSHVVRFPPRLVLEAMAEAPRHFVLGARDPSCDLDLASGNTFCTTDGCGTQIVDFETRELRPSTKSDVAAVTRLIDALPGLAFWWPTVAAGDHGALAQLHELDAGFCNTVKHLQAMVQGERQARCAVEMACAVAGGAEALRRRPLMSDLIGTVSPLVHDRDGIEAALVFAEAGVPVCFVSMPTLGTTAPATKAGALAVGSAELVSATVLLQLAHPGAPVLHSIMQSWIDPRSGAFLSFPLDGRARWLATELAHVWGVPSEAACCGTDATVPGAWQAGVEEASDLSLAALEGSELLPSVGLMSTYTVFWPEHLLLGHDIYQRARHAVMQLHLDDDELALDVVQKVGPGGHYLAQAHTRAHLRTSTALAITHVPASGGGYRDPVEVAREEAERLYHEYRPQPLDDSVRAELGSLLAAVETKLNA
jgi:trimethylamine---corrinoid protein Co-methyltransferase